MVEYKVTSANQEIYEFDFDTIEKAMKATELLHTDNENVHVQLIRIEDNKVIGKFNCGIWSEVDHE